jgi:hypothetical protein
MCVRMYVCMHVCVCVRVCVKSSTYDQDRESAYILSCPWGRDDARPDGVNIYVCIYVCMNVCICMWKCVQMTKIGRAPTYTLFHGDRDETRRAGVNICMWKFLKGEHPPILCSMGTWCRKTFSWSCECMRLWKCMHVYIQFLGDVASPN